MPSTAPHPRLQRFIDDELARAPLLIDGVLQGLLDAPLRFAAEATTAERRAMIDMRDSLQRQRPKVVRAFAEALREQVLRVAAEQAAAARGTSLRDADELSLSLVDDGAVAADVELSRAIEIIHSTAEGELRELRGFTSAIVGDVHVAHDTNPFSPDAYGQALLKAVQVLNAPQDQQLALMHDVAMPLARALRKAYAAACTRLEDEGVAPAVYRTVVMAPGQAGSRTKVFAPAPADLHALRDSMPVPFDMEPQPSVPGAPGNASLPGARGGVPQTAPAPTPTLPKITLDFELPEAPRSRVDQQLIELLTRLFDVILADRGLPKDVQLLLSRLQAPAVRVALHDAAMLDSYDHPVWEFMDRLVFDMERLAHEATERERLLRYIENLLDNIVHEAAQNAGLYRWGVDRLAAYEQHLLQRQCAEAQSQIDVLRTAAVATPELGPADHPASPALDIGSLETVPAELMDFDRPATAPSAVPPLPETTPGEWLRVFLQGGWRELKLLWTDARGQLWLFRQSGGHTWALRRPALERLHHAGLTDTMSPPSLVQHAAQQVLRQVPGAR